jgi:hypothetical protein
LTAQTNSACARQSQVGSLTGRRPNAPEDFARFAIEYLCDNPAVSICPVDFSVFVIERTARNLDEF